MDVCSCSSNKCHYIYGGVLMDDSSHNYRKPTLDPKSSHYDAGGIETIEILRAKLTKEQYKGYLLGNIIKYSTRANFKDQFNRDIEKINVYSDQLKQLNEENNG